MNPVPAKFRNIINPWQSRREIRGQAKTAEKILGRMKDDPQAAPQFLMEHVPDRVWSNS